ncbi:hypothetical protein RCL_jg13871.t1 [Rhizophagus clarus]|uniref:Uncharacterized protein n=1 Tax=Rhizophagus clarus TaxID=94130 RepID=A0A8H3QU86_9GLOM|nr:hypothetical protein RCL_jg13871.t1 [Rhizophagus clarus]
MQDYIRTSETIALTRFQLESYTVLKASNCLTDIAGLIRSRRRILFTTITFLRLTKTLLMLGLSTPFKVNL